MALIAGILDWQGRGDGRLRRIDGGLVASADDPIVPVHLVQKFNLRHAHWIVAGFGPVVNPARAVSRQPPDERSDENVNSGPTTPPATIDGQGGGSDHIPGPGQGGRRRRRRRRRRGGGGSQGYREGRSGPSSGPARETAIPPLSTAMGEEQVFEVGHPSIRPRTFVNRIVAIEGLDPADFAKRKKFEDLTSIDPQPRLTLEYPACPPANRLIDLFCPIGYGTRGLIVSPPKAGKTTLLQQICHGIKENHPSVEVVALLIDERPEEVTDFKRNVPCLCLASSNDQDTERHIALAIFAIERAKRMLEAGRDVVVVLDSLTRMGRAFNASRTYASSGRTMTGGLDSRALMVPKQLFGAARKAEEGGSLTIIASCLVDTGSQADQIIFEEFKGTGNMELILDRSIAEKRIFPAINLAASGTRKEHLLMSEKELTVVTALRRRLLTMPPAMQMEQLLGAVQRSASNAALING